MDIQLKRRDVQERRDFRDIPQHEDRGVWFQFDEALSASAAEEICE
jgi:hypothetical protein